VALGYQEDTPDPSIYIKFRLTEDSRRSLVGKVPGDLPLSLVAWTTTPWTLPGNTALAVQRYAEYAVAEVGGEGLILASPLLGAVLDEGFKVVATLTGEELTGLRYEPLYEPDRGWGVTARLLGTQPVMDADTGQSPTLAPTITDLPSEPDGWPADAVRRVVAAEFVSLNDGTGIVHIAPAFGAEDFELGRAEKLLFVQPVDLRGEMTGGPFAGLFVKDADKSILSDLEERGLLLRQETIRHTYPFCWRCSTPLLYYAKPTWYIRTTKVKESLNEANERVNWYPQHIKHGRFGDWLRNNVDWALSRERYWGTPLPIWRCEGCGALRCIGSRADIRERALDPAAVDALTDLHRPYVDQVKLSCQSCDGTMSRLPEVMDCWFDSGAMPYAQWHYPFENVDTFDRSFPADFICEAVDQTRGWFYTLHAEAALLQAAEAAPENISYRNVICLGHIQDDKGRKMSKSQGNVVEPMEVIEAHGADALRWYLYTATRPGEARRFSARLVLQLLRHLR
jgi:isoleucyl-tRNA synthetase